MAKQSIPQLKQELLTLRDEMRVRIHLGSMELKEKWQQLEPKIAELEKGIDKVSRASRLTIYTLLMALRELRGALQIEQKNEEQPPGLGYGEP